jgi:hypothetical protein
MIAVYNDATKTMVIWQFTQSTKDLRQKCSVKVDIGSSQSLKPADIYFSEDEQRVNIYFLESKR